MKRNVFARIAVAAVVLTTLAACTSPTDAGEGGAENQSDKYVIGVSEPVAGQPWRELALATLLNLANQPEYVDRVEIRIVRTQNNDAAAQNAAMRDLIAAGVDAIIFDPASPTAADPVIAQAEEQGIPMIAAAQAVENPYVYNVATDYDAAGTIGAEWLAEQLTGDKNVAFFEGIKGAPINESAVPKAIEIFEAAGANIIAMTTSEWDDAVAQQNMAALLQSGQQIDGVYVYLAGGIGVIQAYEAAGLPFVPVATGAGYNNEACTFNRLAPQGLEAIAVSGQQAIYAKALEQAVAVLDGEVVDKNQLFDPRALSTENLEELNASCLTDKPDLFGINYEFPGLDLPLEDTLKYYEG